MSFPPTMRVLHVTETLATGVLDVIARMSHHQASLGHHVTVLHSPRRETPPDTVLRQRIGSAKLITAGRADQTRAGRLKSLWTALSKESRSSGIDVVHLHSSFAGVVGRLSSSKATIIYSPHGFAFLRQDVSPVKARLYQAVEALLARRSDAILCVSSAEESVARSALRTRTVLVPNRLRTTEFEPRPPRLHDGLPLILNVGRWSPQKAPERFVRAARVFRGQARFRWIGDGPEDASPDVSISGWITPEEAALELSEATLIFFTSRWEGMPVGLMQAQALGVPAVALRCVGVDDVVVDGVTGVIVDDEAAAHTVLADLLGDPRRLATMRSDAISLRDRFSDEGYGVDLMTAYKAAGAQRG